jgi:opacity protein-like surface antigen
MNPQSFAAKMKTSYCAVASLVLIAASTATAQVSGRVYVAADAGVSFLEDTTAHTTFLSLPVNLKAEFEPGYRTDLRIGYFVPQGASLNFRGSELVCNFAFEFDTGIAANSFTTEASASADLYQVPLLLNAIIEFPLSDRLSLGLGMGLGGALTMIQARSALGEGTSTGAGFAYQGVARISYFLSPHFTVSAFSKVMAPPRSSFPEEPFQGTGIGPIKMDGPLSITGGLGLTYIF